jgi:hypothetical protein
VSPEAPRVDQAERWLRILRLHGRTAETLRRIGLRERPLATVAEPSRRFRGPGQQDVISRAAELARAAGAQTTDTVHVLFAVRAVFGSAFDRALYDGGTAWNELTDALVTVAEPEAVR